MKLFLILCFVLLLSQSVYAGDDIVIGATGEDIVGVEASGILMIGDEEVYKILSSAPTLYSVDHYLSDDSGLRAYSFQGKDATDILTGDIGEIQYIKSIHTVIVYISRAPNLDDYLKLLNKIKSLYKDSIIKCHLTGTNTELDSYMKTLQGVEVVDYRGNDYAQWRYNIVGSNTSIHTYSQNISVEVNTANPKTTDKLRVTAIHSVNAMLGRQGLDVYYIPRLEELPFSIKDYIESGSGGLRGFASAYTGYYNLEVDAEEEFVNKEDSASRPLEILGYDMTLDSERCELYVQNKLLHADYAYTSEERVSLKTAVMNIYKSLNKYCYDTKVAFLPDASLTKETSPISQVISNGEWDTTEGACYTYITRTNPDKYWKLAMHDNLLVAIQNYYNTYIIKNADEYMTLGEFCMMVAASMQVYGEPILTATEENMLLQVYGSKLPNNLTDTGIFSAVKYLTAKGILDIDNKDYNFLDELTREDMYNILLAVANKDSRFTFKDIELSIDPTLVDLGYFATKLEPRMSVIGSIEGYPVSENVEYYDYYIHKSFIAGNPFDIQVEGYPDECTYVGEVRLKEESYYHYKINAYMSGALKLTNALSVVNVEAVGGVVNTNGQNTFDYYNADIYLADKTREEASTSRQLGTTMLAGNSEFIVSFSTMNVNWENVMWNSATTLRGIDVGPVTIDGVTFTDMGTSNGRRYVKISGNNLKSQDISSKLKYTGSSGTMNAYSAYVQANTGNLLVPVSFLKDIDRVSDVNVYTESNTLSLVTDVATAFIDNNNKTIASGNVVFKTEEDDILFISDGNETFVDIRAIVGFTQDFYKFWNTSDGTLSISVQDKLYRYSMNYTTLQVYQSDSNYITTSGYENALLLCGGYPLSNYVYYTSDTMDTLFVFKRKAKSGDRYLYSEYDAQLGYNRLKECGLELKDPDSYWVYSYDLYRVAGDSKASGNPQGIEYIASSNEFVYKPQASRADWIEDYYSSPYFAGVAKSYATGAYVNDIILPIVSYGSKLYDINFNMFEADGKTLPYGVIPESLVSNKPSSNVLMEWTGFQFAPYSGGMSFTNLTVLPAPVGVVSAFVNIPKRTWDSIDNTASIFYGSMITTLRDGALYLKDIYKIDDKTNGKNNKFSVLRQARGGLGSTIMSYDLSISYTGITTDSTVESDKDNPADMYDENTNLRTEVFDWKTFSETSFVSAIDDGLTIMMLLVVSVIPRIVIYICVALIGLSLITNVKIWIKFCDNVFDIYKILTLGRQDVHTINTRIIFISSIIGIGFFWLFLDGSVFRLFGWFTELVVSISLR